MDETRRTGGDPIALYSDDVLYIGAQPKEEGEYWTIIKANLDNFIFTTGLVASMLCQPVEFWQPDLLLHYTERGHLCAPFDHQGLVFS
jgi:hypothetical protein